MRDIKQLSGLVVLSLFLLAGCHGATPQQNMISGAMISGANTPQPALQIVRGQQGGGLAYTAVASASNQAGGLTFILRTVHNDCGEQPKIGQPFQFSGTQMVGVFFTVVNHSQGNEQLAGLALATLSGPNQVQAGLVFDDASRIGSTVNPLLTQLFSVWKPVAPAATGGTSGSGIGGLGQPSGVPQSPVPPLHRVTAPDNSASIGVPDGWQLEQGNSGRGAHRVRGTNGEQIGISMYRGGVDPTDPTQRQLMAEHYNLIPPGTVVYAYRGDIVHEFVPLFQALRKAGGLGPMQMEVKSAQLLPPQPNQVMQCVVAGGQMDPDGKGMQFFSCMMCASKPAPPPQGGGYSVSLSNTTMPLAVAPKEQNLANAVIKSYVPNAQVIKQEINQQMQQKQQSDQQTREWAQQYVNQIHQIGQQATQRMNETEDNYARNDQGFDNYLLDQSVVQNNATGGHSTQVIRRQIRWCG